MTIPNTVNVLTAVGPQSSPLSLPFLVVQQADVAVYLQSAAGVTPVKLTLNTDYTVALLNQLAGAQLLFVSTGAIGASLATGAILTISRDPAQVQTTALQAQGPFPAPSVQQITDQLTTEVQANRTRINNSIQFPVVESLSTLVSTLPVAAIRATTYLGFDSSGNVACLAANSTSGTSVTATGTTTARFLADRFSDILNVRDFGAKLDGVTDDLAAWNAAITYAHSTRGTIFMPAGTSFVSAAITMQVNVRIVGTGNLQSIIKSSHTGDGILMSSPINSSTAVHTAIRDVQFWNTNGSNTGGGYDDVGGTYVTLDDCYFNGFKYGIIFDQTEIADVSRCLFQNCLLGGIWMVNGADHTGGASGFYTNRIRITGNQFNVPSTAYGIIDDGGVCHSVLDNNFQGGICAMRLCGSEVVVVAGNECEASTGESIRITNVKLGGGSVQPPLALAIRANLLDPTAGQVCVNFAGTAESVSFDDNWMDTNQANAITTCGNCNEISLSNNYNSGSGTLTDAPPAVAGIQFDKNGLAIPVSNLSVGAGAGLPADVAHNLVMIGGATRKIYVGPGTGDILKFCSRTASTDTDLFSISDTGLFRILIAQSAGYGTPTNGAHQASFDATTISTTNVAKALAQLIVDLIKVGVISA